MAASAGTFPRALEDRCARSPGDPAVTFYDVASGERVELSYLTYANWVAKTGSLLQDELGITRGDVLAVDLPCHWLGPVWLGAAWSVGVVTGDRSLADGADVVVCGPGQLEQHASGSAEVVGCSLLPMGARFRTPLPPGVIDFGEVVWSQPDTLLVIDPPVPADLAWRDAAGALSHSELLGLPGPDERIVTEAVPSTGPGLSRLVAPLLHGVGTVWVTGDPSPEWLARTAAAERARVDA